jgi:WD40 repeat protein
VNVYDQNFVLLNSFQAHTGQIERIKQSTFNNYVATGSQDFTVKIWDPISNGTLIATYPGVSFVHTLEFIDIDTIAIGTDADGIVIWSICTGQTRLNINTGIFVISLKLLANGFYLAAGLGTANINIYDTNNGGLITTLTGHTAWVRDLVLINNSTLASSSYDPDIRIWDLTTFSLKFTLIGHSSWIFGLKLITTDILASGSWDTNIILWNTTSGTLIRTLNGHSFWIWWSLDVLTQSGSQALVSGSSDTTIKVWDWTNGQCLNTINTGLDIMSLAVITDNNPSKFKKF